MAIHKKAKSEYCAMIGERLRQCRGRKTLAQVAEQTYLASNTIMLYEHGRVEPGVEAVKRLCDYYKVTLGSVLDVERSVDNA